MSSVERLIGKIENKELVLPEFQREFTWKKDQSRVLLDSLIKEYPTGSLLIWKTENIPALKNMPDFVPHGRVEVLLDGQQRLTALYMFLIDEIPPYYSNNDISGNDPRNLYYNLETTEFKYYKPLEMQNNLRWVRVCDCFKNNVKLKEIVKKIASEEERFETYDCLKANLDKILSIKTIEYPIMYVKESANLKHALTVFDRVNSGGTPLSESDIALAHMCSNWFDTRRVFKEKLKFLKNEGFDFSLTFLIRAMNAVINGRAEYSLLHDVSQNDLRAGWEKLDRLLDFLINFLKDRAYIYSSADLTTYNVLIPIIGYFAQNEPSSISAKKVKKILYWMYAALFLRRYSGSVDQKLEKDLNALKERNPIDALLVILKEDEGEPNITPENLDSRSISHPFYNMSCIVIRSRGGVDWSNGLFLGAPIGNSYRIEKHHIFPKSFLAEAGYDVGNNLIHKKRVNEIANRIPLTRDGNMDIFNHAPEEYLPKVEKKNPGNLEKFMVPMDRELWEVKNYEKFLEDRRRLLAKGINDFMKSLLL
ncbi:MAG: DUF262 domain-containing protein [Halanaerobiales bacterium]|nr:DUF262 domain-containing protein [Halanaerobiales bacterium]